MRAHGNAEQRIQRAAAIISVVGASAFRRRLLQLLRTA
jgi:hypothetical protein